MDGLKNNTVNSNNLEPTEVMDTPCNAENPTENKVNVKDVFKQKTVRAAICAVLGVAVVGGGAYAATAGLRNTNSTAAPAITATQVAYEEDDSIESIKLNYTADGLKEDSTPVIVHIIGQAVADTSATTAEQTTADYTSDDTQAATVDIDFYHAFSAKDALDGKAVVDVQKGTYKVVVLPSLNADGSLNSGTTEAIDAKGNTEASKEESTKAETTTASTEAATTDKAAIKDEDKTSAATSKAESSKAEDKKSDSATTESKTEEKADEKTNTSSESKTEDAKSDTTKDDKDDSEDEKSSTIEIKGETTKAEDVSKEQIDKVLDNLDEAVKKGDSSLTGDKGTTVTDDYKKAAEANPNTKTEEVEEKTEDTKKQATTEKSQAKTDSSNSSTSTSSTTNNSNNNQSSSKFDNQQQSQPTHTHNWATQYKTVADYSDVWVQDSAAWDEQVLVSDGYYEDVYACVAVFRDGHVEYTADGAADYSIKSHLGYDTDYRVVGQKWIDTSYYQTVHHEATGHYESQPTGSHQEVSGYKCLSCGATK